MNIPDKLKKFHQKIQSSSRLDTDLKNYIAIELYNFIQEVPVLQKEFHHRTTYLENLVNNPKIKELQNQLFLAIVDILNLVNKKDIENIQKEWNNALVNCLKIQGEEKDTLTLPEAYEALKDPNNYYSLGESSYRTIEDHYYSIPLSSIKNQYLMAEKVFQFIVAFLTEKKDKNLQEQYTKLTKIYNKFWYKLDELIHQVLITLHIREFEEFLILCAHIHPKEGLEMWYGFSIDDNLEKIKKMCDTVITDLIESAEKDIIDTSINEINATTTQTVSNYNHPITIKKVHLREENYLLEINEGDKIISFRSKKGGKGTEKEKKVFKILIHLWQIARWEKIGNVTKKATDMMDFATLKNLKKDSGCPTEGAVKKQLNRLNKRFKEENVPIIIECKNENCRIIIHKS